MASGVVGMLAPSHTQKQLQATSFFASSRSSSFCVAQGRAMSQGWTRGGRWAYMWRGVCLDVFLDTAAVHFLDLLDGIQVDSIGVIDEAVGVRHGQDSGTQFSGFLAGVDGNVAGAGNNDFLAFEACSFVLQQSFCKITEAITGGFGASRNRRRTGLCRSERRTIHRGSACTVRKDIRFPGRLRRCHLQVRRCWVRCDGRVRS